MKMETSRGMRTDVLTLWGRLRRISYSLFLVTAVVAAVGAVASSRSIVPQKDMQAAVSGATPTQTPCQAWVERTAVPYNAGGIFAVSDGTYVYAGGGTDLANGIVHNDLLRYDPMNNSWIPLAPSPDYHALSQAAYLNGKIYNMGGYDENFYATDTTRIYDIAANTWTTGAAMPQALTEMATAVWNGVVYIAGGNTYGGQRVNTLYTYDIDSNTWATLAAMPQALTLPGFGAINGRLYIAGGFGDAGYLDTLYIYDIATNTWATGANLPQSVEGAGTSAFNGLLYVYGGRLPGPTLSNLTWIYDPATNTWSDGPNLNIARYAMYGTAVGNGSIVAPGGLDANLNGLNDNKQVIYTPCSTPTPTTTPRPTPRPRPTPPPHPTPCTIIFSDVSPPSPYYFFVRCLACRGIVSGYSDGTFRLFNDMTRAQTCKWVSLAAGFNDPILEGIQTFQDVDPDNPFWLYIERLALRGIVSGYLCGGPGEPCIPPQNRPYFRPYSFVTRGQISKVVSVAAGFNDSIPGDTQTFQDVPPSDPFWLYIERLALRGIVSGYDCGGPGEPCIPPQNRSYFRPYAYATRGQAAKIVSLTFFPDCHTP